jgi:hypothetical protein
MLRRADASVAALLAFAMAAGGGCSRSAAQNMEVGRHHVRLVPPRGWEHLDHGREQVFRNGETKVLLADFGPSTREGMALELTRARDTWLRGYRRDALARVRELRGAPLTLATNHERAVLWQPWYEVTTRDDSADSATIGHAFEEMSHSIEGLSDVPAESLAAYALRMSEDMRRREIASLEHRKIHGAEWTVVETWDRVSHLYRSRLASLDNGGRLLALRTEGGTIGLVGPVFEALLSSIEIAPEADSARGGI